MLLSPKQAAIQAASRYPVYRVLPPGALRTYAMLRYHTANSAGAELARVLSGIRGISPRHRTLALAAIRAAFRLGQDELVREALAGLEERFPESAGIYELRSDVHVYRGEYAAALEAAELAREVAPSRAAATARVVRLTYLARSAAEGDQVALDAVAKFPLHDGVMWSVARNCDSSGQYARITERWHAQVSGQALAPGQMVRQLATAATRAREIQAATDLYRRGVLEVHAQRRNPLGPVRGRFEGRGVTPLAGRNAWSAIEDLAEALDRAGVAYFFAAGTALGFVREGGPLSSDTDVDVGVMAEDWDRDALVACFTADPRFDIDEHPLSSKVHLIHRGGTPIDIFRFYEEDRQWWHDGVFVRWRNSPFGVTRRPVRGLAVPLPEDTDTYLTENYGDWRTPNSSFDPFTEDAPNMEVTWPEYQEMHLVRRAFKQVLAADAPAAQASLVAAGDTVTASALST